VRDLGEAGRRIQKLRGFLVWWCDGWWSHLNPCVWESLCNNHPGHLSTGLQQAPRPLPLHPTIHPPRGSQSGHSRAGPDWPATPPASPPWSRRPVADSLLPVSEPLDRWTPRRPGCLLSFHLLIQTTVQASEGISLPKEDFPDPLASTVHPNRWVSGHTEGIHRKDEL
jgi:hypothetical protein